MQMQMKMEMRMRMRMEMEMEMEIHMLTASLAAFVEVCGRVKTIISKLS